MDKQSSEQKIDAYGAKNPDAGEPLADSLLVLYFHQLNRLVH